MIVYWTFFKMIIQFFHITFFKQINCNIIRRVKRQKHLNHKYLHTTRLYKTEIQMQTQSKYLCD